MGYSKATYECLQSIFGDVLKRMIEDIESMNEIDDIKQAKTIGREEAYHDVLRIIFCYLNS